MHNLYVHGGKKQVDWHSLKQEKSYVSLKSPDSTMKLMKWMELIPVVDW